MVGTLRRSALVLVGIALLVPAWLLQPLPARAAGVVTTCNDGGAGSLRAAIAGGGAVTFQAGLNCTGASAIVLTGGTLTIAADTTIDATGATIAVDGGCTGCQPGGTPSGGTQIFAVNSGVTATFRALTLQHGHTNQNGAAIGAIDATVTVANCTFTENDDLDHGGGLSFITASTFGGALQITNSTFTGNTSEFGNGAAIFVDTIHPVSITSSTIANNVGGVSAVWDNLVLPATLTNTLVARTTGASDLGGGPFTGDHNLIDDGSIGHLSGAGNISAPALLGALGQHGGPEPTIPLLPGSPAIDAGATVGSGPLGNTVPATDQRGKPRPVDIPGVTNASNGTDIGAVEMRGFTLALTSGNNQTTVVTQPFANPLVVTLSETGGAALPGGAVTFTAPASGASATLTGSPATTDTNGHASVTATANGTAGGYSVIASTPGATSVTFNLTNVPPITLVVNSSGDGLANSANCAVGNANTCRLRDAIAAANGGLAGANPTITFDSTAFPSGTATTITLDATTGTLTLAHDVAIDGTNHIVAVDGGCTGCEPGGAPVGGVRVFDVNSGVTARLTALTIQHGAGSGGVGGGISVGGTHIGGTLTVTHCILTGNRANLGAAIDNNGGTLTVVDSAFVANNAGSQGAAIANGGGTLTVTGSAFTGNRASSSGSAIWSLGGSTRVANSTFSGNYFAVNTTTGGAIWAQGGPVSVTSSTIAGNGVAGNGAAGGIAVNAVTVTLTDTIVAGNTGTDLGIVGGGGFAGDNNLIGDGSAPVSGGGNLSGTAASPLDPRLAPLGAYGGATRTLPLLPGSPAIDAGAPVGSGPSGNTVPATDQRGRPRVGAPDIGAFESQGFTLTKVGGDNQSAVVNTAFAPLVVAVTAKGAGEPVQGGLVTFTAPASGATAAVTGSPATVGANGQASVGATANGIAGSYTVTATTPGASSVAFALTNTAPLVSIAVTPANGTLKVGQIVQYTATGTYADGTTADLTGAVAWASDVPRTAVVDAGGRATGASPGTAGLTASQGSISGQTSVTVAAPTAIGIAPAPAPANRPGSVGTTPPAGTPAPPHPLPAGR